MPKKNYQVTPGPCPLKFSISRSGVELEYVGVYETPPSDFDVGEPWKLVHMTPFSKYLVQSPAKAQWHRPQPERGDEGSSTAVTVAGGGVRG